MNRYPEVQRPMSYLMISSWLSKLLLVLLFNASSTKVKVCDERVYIVVNSPVESYMSSWCLMLSASFHNLWSVECVIPFLTGTRKASLLSKKSLRRTREEYVNIKGDFYCAGSADQRKVIYLAILFSCTHSYTTDDAYSSIGITNHIYSFFVM